MNRLFNNKKLLVLVVSVVAFIGLAVASVMNSGQNSATTVNNEAASLINRSLAAPANWFDNLITSFHRLINVYQENESLRKNMDSFLELQTRNESLAAENAKLKELLGLKETLADYSTTPANVISRTPDTWNNQLIIDVGSEQGITVGMIVMGNGGIIGRVSSVSLSSSKVTLLTTSELSNAMISAMIIDETNSINGVVNGYDADKNTYLMRNIDINANVVPGQRVVTSGLSGMTPSSLLIGTVESVNIDNSGLFKEAVIKPAGNAVDIRYVIVVKQKNESGE